MKPRATLIGFPGSRLKNSDLHVGRLLGHALGTNTYRLGKGNAWAIFKPGMALQTCSKEISEAGPLDAPNDQSFS